MYPNFAKIAELQDLNFAIVLASNEDEERRKRLEQTFPEFYTNEENPIPISFLRKASEYFCRNDLNTGVFGEGDITKERELGWDTPLSEFGIKCVFDWHKDFDEEDNEMPSDVYDQIQGKPLKGDLMVEYNGMKLILTGWNNEVQNDINQPLDLKTKDYYFVLAFDAKFIDLNS